MAERTARAGATAGMEEAVSSPTGRPLSATKTEVVDEAKSMVRTMADQQRHRAAEQVSGLGRALHRVADDMGKENEVMGRYTQMAADRLDQAAEYLRRSDFDSLIEGAEEFARRQPYLFVGGMLAAGFLTARVLKSAGSGAVSSAGTGTVSSEIPAPGAYGAAMPEERP